MPGGHRSPGSPGTWTCSNRPGPLGKGREASENGKLKLAAEKDITIIIAKQSRIVEYHRDAVEFKSMISHLLLLHRANLAKGFAAPLICLKLQSHITDRKPASVRFAIDARVFRSAASHLSMIVDPVALIG